MASIIRKLTIKSISDKPTLKDLIEHTEIPLCRVYGIANGMKPDSTDYGNFVRFMGDFRGTNLKTGEQVRSGQMIMPKIIEDLIAGQLVNPEISALEFGFEIGMRLDETVATKYVYTAKSLIEAAENDPLIALENKMKLLTSNVTQIKPVEEKASEPAPAPAPAPDPEQGKAASKKRA
jgi:hypothetical protein